MGTVLPGVAGTHTSHRGPAGAGRPARVPDLILDAGPERHRDVVGRHEVSAEHLEVSDDLRDGGGNGPYSVGYHLGLQAQYTIRTYTGLQLGPGPEEPLPYTFPPED